MLFLSVEGGRGRSFPPGCRAEGTCAPLARGRRPGDIPSGARTTESTPCRAFSHNESAYARSYGAADSSRPAPTHQADECRLGAALAAPSGARVAPRQGRRRPGGCLGPSGGVRRSAARTIPGASARASGRRRTSLGDGLEHVELLQVARLLGHLLQLVRLHLLVARHGFLDLLYIPKLLLELHDVLGVPRQVLEGARAGVAVGGVAVVPVLL